jgi:hypothetical protein
MSFKTLNRSTRGGSLRGYVNTTYTELVSAFGKPTEGDGYKVDCEWIIEFDDGEQATIYNYKDGLNYCGADGKPTEEITDWHVGGEKREALKRVLQYVSFNSWSSDE